MKTKNKSVIIFTIISISFLSGMIFVEYELYPYSSIKSSLVTNDIPQNVSFYEKNDVSKLIHVTDMSQLNKLRSDVNTFLWNQQQLPSELPSYVEINHSDSRYAELKNLDSIDMFSIDMENGVNSIQYLFKPIDANNKLIIYHQGHKGDFIEGKQIIQHFLENKFTVLASSMPLLGMNSQPIIEHPNFGTFKLTSHNQLKFLESDNFSTMKFFIHPIILALNHLSIEENFESVHMIGISGGGWTTTLVSAIDDRIDQSFSVAGSYPIFLRTDPKNFGDYEQTNPDFYKITNYLDLYIMAASGSDRKHIQIFNKYDPCCFDGDNFLIYEADVKKIVNEINNNDSFMIFLDDTHNEHKISEHALGIIDNEINNFQKLDILKP